MLYFTNMERAGLLPQFFSLRDPRPARDQLHEAYAHGGGVSPFEGFELNLNRDKPAQSTITYPGDPAYQVICWAKLRDELILFFPGSWLVIVQPDNSFITTRCD